MSADDVLIVCLCMSCEFTLGFFRILVTGNVEGIYTFILFSNYKELENLKSSVGVFCWPFQTFTPPEN